MLLLTRIISRRGRLMSSLPPRELLDAMHQFPGKFVFKAVGKADVDFVTEVISVVREVLELEFDPPFETRETPAGRHVAVTVTPVSYTHLTLPTSP
jgi:putative lipoic acid-binding regulatory protein